MTRTYESSHPWISFRVDLRSAPVDLWLLLGEAASKAQHVAGALLKPSVAEQLNTIYLARGALATTAIEGNTLSEAEAIEAIEGTLKLPPSRDYLRQEIQNIVDACNAIVEELMRGAPVTLTPERIKAFNRQVLAELEHDEDVEPGEVRTHPVVVGRYRAAPAEDCEHLLAALCRWLAGPTFQPAGLDRKVPFAILKAVLAHLYLAWIHPFGDGNGRTARLLEVQILLEAGLPLPVTLLLSSHYNQTRAEYYRQLDRASRSRGDVIPFVHYAVGGLRDGLREQLRVIGEQQMADRWEQFVYETFGAANSASARRQRRLVLDLSRHDEPVAKPGLRRLSPELAEAYAGKTDKTLTRDVNALLKSGLIERTSDGYRARPETVRAFRPIRPGDSA